MDEIIREGCNGTAVNPPTPRSLATAIERFIVTGRQRRRVEGTDTGIGPELRVGPGVGRHGAGVHGGPQITDRLKGEGDGRPC
ncbi:MAG: hypothetical protein MZU95_12425 [Desulfomicrobium escambiense]|nr:hypothetical protein [Desulfomicrobium escambiense]